MNCCRSCCWPASPAYPAVARSRPLPIGAITMAATWLQRLGFKRSRGPSQSTLHRIFKGIDQKRLEQALSHWAQAVISRLSGRRYEPLQGWSVDGKTLCGSTKQGARDAHLLSCISQSVGVVVAQVAVANKTNEISQVAELLEGWVLTGKVITGDALAGAEVGANGEPQADG